MSGETADREPRLDSARKFARALDLHQARTSRIRKSELSQVHPGDALEVTPNREVVAKPWVGVAEVWVVALQHEPVALLLVTKLEPNNVSPKRQLVRPKVGQDGPHQHVAIEVLSLNFEKLLTPYTEAPHELGELAPGFGQVIHRTPAGGVRTGFDDSSPFETAQSQPKHAWRDRVEAPADLAEVMMAAHDLADDQGRPALGEYL
jgi:hypothetical protein